MSLTQSFYIQDFSSNTYIVVQDTNTFYRLLQGDSNGTTIKSLDIYGKKIVKQTSHYVFSLEYNTSNVFMVTHSQVSSGVFRSMGIRPETSFKQLYIANNKPYLISSDDKYIYTIEKVIVSNDKDINDPSNVIKDINDSSINTYEYFKTQRTKFQPPTGYVVTYIDFQGNITLYKSGKNPDLKIIKAPLVSIDLSGYEPQVRQEPLEPYVAQPNKKNNTVIWMLVILLILFFLYMKHSASH